MSCKICNRNSCTESFHSLEEQQNLEEKPKPRLPDGWHPHPNGGYQLILNNYRFAQVAPCKREGPKWFADHHPFMGHYIRTDSLREAFDFIACRFPEYKPDPEWIR